MKSILTALLLAMTLLAGCSDSGTTEQEEDDFDDVEVEVTEDTGAVLGVVVDQAVLPVEGALVRLETDGGDQEKETDDQGRFSFDGLPAGTYFLEVTKAGYDEVQTSVDVVAGVSDPKRVKVQLSRLFDQDPFTEQVKLQGFIACSYQVAILSAPCVTDYTSIAVPGGAAPELRNAQGDTRDYTIAISEGWQSMVVEMNWEPSASGTSPEMGGVMSYEGRLASHGYARWEGPSPLRVQVDEGVPGPGGDEPVPSEGLGELLVFFGVRGGDQPAGLSVNQEFEVFHHTFYFGEPPEGWSFLAGDQVPF